MSITKSFGRAAVVVGIAAVTAGATPGGIAHAHDTSLLAQLATAADAQAFVLQNPELTAVVDGLYANPQPLSSAEQVALRYLSTAAVTTLTAYRSDCVAIIGPCESLGSTSAAAAVPDPADVIAGLESGYLSFAVPQPDVALGGTALVGNPGDFVDGDGGVNGNRRVTWQIVIENRAGTDLVKYNIDTHWSWDTKYVVRAAYPVGYSSMARWGWSYVGTSPNQRNPTNGTQQGSVATSTTGNYRYSYPPCAGFCDREGHATIDTIQGYGGYTKARGGWTS